MDFFWITRDATGTVEYLYNFDEKNPSLSTWGRYLKYREQDIDKIDSMFLKLSLYFNGIDIIAFDEKDDKYRMGTTATRNNVGLSVYGTSMPKNLNEYCTFCRRECKQPGFVIIELCPDFIEK